MPTFMNTPITEEKKRVYESNRDKRNIREGGGSNSCLFKVVEICITKVFYSILKDFRNKMKNIISEANWKVINMMYCIIKL